MKTANMRFLANVNVDIAEFDLVVNRRGKIFIVTNNGAVPRCARPVSRREAAMLVLRHNVPKELQSSFRVV